MGFCSNEDSDCTWTERRFSLAEVPEEPPLSVRGLEISVDAQDELIDVLLATVETYLEYQPGSRGTP